MKLLRAMPCSFICAAWLLVLAAVLVLVLR